MPLDPKATVSADFVATMLDTHRLSQQRLGDLVGATRRAVAYWKDGDYDVPPETADRMIRLDTALRVTRGDREDECPWVNKTMDGALCTAELPDVREVMYHVDGCPSCMARAYGAVMAPALTMLRARAR